MYTIVISIVAVIVSVVSWVISYRQQSNMLKLNFRNSYNYQIFSVYLLKKIPETAKHFRFVKGELSKIYKEKMNRIILDLKKDIIFFKYKDKRFYEKIYLILLTLDDKLVEISGIKNNDENKEKAKNDFEKEIIRLYKAITHYLKI